MFVKISEFIFVNWFLSLGIYQVFKRDHYDSKWSYDVGFSDFIESKCDDLEIDGGKSVALRKL